MVIGQKMKQLPGFKNFNSERKRRAEKYLSFIETYRSYVVTYNLGEIIIRDYMEKNGGTEDNLARRWEIFTN